MGLSLQSGGYLTHRHYTNEKKVIYLSYFFEYLPYTTQNYGYIDYEQFYILHLNILILLLLQHIMWNKIRYDIL